MQQQRKIRVLEAIRQGQVGGGETHILNLVEHIDKSRFEPVVLSFTDGQMIDALNEKGIKNHIIPSTKAFDVLKWQKVRKLLKEEKIDIVHVHGTRANTNIYWAARSLGLPVIYTIHGWSFHDDQSWFVKRSRICFEQLFTSKAVCNISVSASNQKTGFKHISNFDSVVINNGINLEIFNPNRNLKNVRKELGIDENKCVIGFAGRMTLQKDPLTLIKAFQKVLPENKNALLLMVGDGELKEKAIQLVAELEIEKSVVFEKFRSDMPDVLNAMDVFCLPSLWEGLPIALLEAMAMSKPVVATAVDGSKEIIHHQQNGLIVPPMKPDALADAISILVKNKLLRQQLSTNARETVASKFDVKKMTKQIENVYLNTLHLN